MVTNEDIAVFTRWRLALKDADIVIKKGCDVMPGLQHGLIRTLDIYITLSQKDINNLLEKGSLSFWQYDLETAIVQHSSFFIPVRVFIKEQKKISSIQ